MIDTERTEILRDADCFITKEVEFKINKDQLAYGDFSDNCHGWLWTNAVQFAHPILAKGKQGFWNYDMP